MPDWRVREFEGKFTDEFAHSNSKEHEGGVENPGVTSSKKLKHAAAGEKEGPIPGSNSSDSQKCNSEDIQRENGIVSQNINGAGDCIGGCKNGSNAFPSREENTIAETRCPTDNWNSCQFALNNGSSILNTPPSLTYGDNDLNYIDWPGIDNFEDVDTLFRSSDSTYGQQQLENADGLSWIPSSDAVYSSDVAMQQEFDSSYSDYGILDDLSAFQCAEDKSLPSIDPSSALCDNQFNDAYLFSEQKNVNSYGEQMYQEDVMELLPTDQICSGHENVDMSQVGNQYSSENAIQGIEDTRFPIASTSQLSSSQNLLNQRHHLDSSSPSNITSDSYPEKFGPSSGSFAQRNSKVQKKTVNTQPRQTTNDNVMNRHPQTRRASYPCENYETERRGSGKRTMGDPQVTMGASMVVDGSFVSSMSSDNSVEESSFRQLQDAVSQLDVQTKLCIRDGLYRLARSAQHRQVFPNMMNSNGDSQDVKDLQNAKTSRKFVDPRGIETQTNPIDRSIALLLFHQSSSDNAAVAVDDASSLKSPAGTKQHQGPAANQGLMPASSVYSPGGQGTPKDVRSLDKY